MIKTCSWCGKVGGENGLEPVGVETHGVCKKCLPTAIAEARAVLQVAKVKNINSKSNLKKGGKKDA